MLNRQLFPKCLVYALFLVVLGSSPLWAVVTVKQGPLLEEEGSLYLCKISPDGTYAAIGGDSTQLVKIYDTVRGLLVGTITLPTDIESEDIELSDSGSRIFVGGQSDGVFCYNKSGKLIWKHLNIDGELSVGATASGDLVFTVDKDGNFYRLDGATGSNLITPVSLNTRGWGAWGVDTTVNGNRVLIQTNSDIIITDGYGAELFFYDIVRGNSISEAQLSPDGTHFAVSFQDPDTLNDYVALYEIGVGEKWKNQVSRYSDVSIDDHNRVYVATESDDNILYSRTGSELARWISGEEYIDAANDGSRFLSQKANSTYVYSVSGYECYPDLHLQAYITNVAPYDSDTKRYTLTITNWYDIPPELFVPSPELPACGLNDQASRTYISFYGSKGALYFTGCTARDGTSSEFLKNLTVNIDDDDVQSDPYIYLQLHDRACDQYINSNYAYLLKPCPVGDLDGDCIVNLRDFTLMAENWLVNRNP
jgi:hypothetical protein